MTNDILVALMSKEEGQKALADHMIEKYGAKEAKSTMEEIKDFFRRIIDSVKSMLNNSDLNRYQKNILEADIKNLENIYEQAFKVFDEAVENYQTTENSADKAEIKHSLYTNALSQYSEKEIKNWENSKRIIILDSRKTFDQFVEDSLAHRIPGKKVYFGKINNKTADRIRKDTGIETEGYNCSLQSYEIEKIIKDHGNEEKERLRGQRAITTEDLFKIPQIIGESDKIEPAGQYEGKPAIHFYKDEYTLLAVVNKKKLDIFSQTIYAKKKSLAPATSDQALVNTSKTTKGTALFPSTNISQSKERSNKKFSLDVALEETKDMIAIHNISTDKLLEDIRIGGFPMPSIAVTKTDQELRDFGDVSVVFRKDTIDPKNRKNKVYSGDAWTPTFPTIEYKVNSERLKNLAKRLGTSYVNLETNVFDGSGDPESRIRNKSYAKETFLKERGIEPIPTHKGYKEIPARARYIADKAPHAQVYVISNNITYDKLISTEGMEKEIADEIRKDGEGKTYGKVLNLKAATFEKMVENVRRDPKYYADDAKTLKRELGIVKGEITENTKEDLGYTDGINEAIEAHSDEFNQWITEAIDGVVDSYGIRNNTDPYKANGDRKSFEQTHYQYTLDNLVRAMMETV